MRPWNWLSRRASSLVTWVRSTVKEPLETSLPDRVSSPVTALVRPTASVSWPNRTSLTR